MTTVSSDIRDANLLGFALAQSKRYSDFKSSRLDGILLGPDFFFIVLAFVPSCLAV